MRKAAFSFAGTLFIFMVVVFGAMAIQVFPAQGQTQNQRQEAPTVFKSRIGIQGVPGFVVTSVSPGDPAEQSGLKPGDIVTLLNGQQFTDIESFQKTILGSEPGTSFELTYLRYNAATGKYDEHKTMSVTKPLSSR